MDLWSRCTRPLRALKERQHFSALPQNTSQHYRSGFLCPSPAHECPSRVLYLTRFPKTDTLRHSVRMEFILRKLVYVEDSELDLHIQLQMGRKTACTIVMDDVTTAHRIMDSASIYAAEAVAIRRALCDLQQDWCVIASSL